MGLKVYLQDGEKQIDIRGTTHNNRELAMQVGVYDVLWKWKEKNIITGADLIKPVSKGLAELAADPDKYKNLDNPNGWGTYDNFVAFLEELFTQCVLHPEARVEITN
ncbi:hypothetical protein [Dyadobacter sp. CY323]|uniref:hypothetical protein n=1 Tax=Dyadobacter sp. CY323 TaxID=2907302 RepID=UPI001F27AD09|nr:hypothetical protein [Dyadobacter sp. CY323]MCE6988150.1 hypothetical protein [Dyadobacter sp. CY323]